MKWMTLSILLITTYLLFANEESSAVKGYWLNETEEYVVEIYQEGSIFKGRVVWLADSLDIYGQPLRDVMNDEPKLRSRLVRGLDVLYDFEFDDGAWRHGEVYLFKNGNSYNARLRLNDEQNLSWTGYYGILFFLGKTKTWTRVYDKEKYGLK